VARLTEAMALDPDEHEHDLGRGAPGAVLREIAGVEGEVEFETEFAPRPEYGLVRPLLTPVDGGFVVRGGAQVLALSFPMSLDLHGGSASGRFLVRAGERVRAALHHRSLEDGSAIVMRPDEIADRLRGTIEAWRSWSAVHQAYEGPWAELVYHSGRVLQALMYQPTGAIVAAPTTSLPEHVGGRRNWDYRYAWVRDASFTLDALWVAACPDEAQRFFGWLAGAVASGIDEDGELQIMFGVGGEHDLSERELAHLEGWRGSRPVRIGNGAWSQRQLDVYGELLGAAHRLRDYLGALDPTSRRFLRGVADAAAERWRSVDHGIWEVRGRARRFTYSRLMCWVALERAIDLAPTIDGVHRVEDWTAARDEIRAAILAEGWNDEAGAFTQSFGSPNLDASSLVIPIVGFLPARDDRVRSTIDAIERHLTDERGLVRRYRVDETDDGLGGDEGSFLVCTFWLAEALARSGEVDRARDVFERAAAYANDVGLMSEAVDGPTGDMLGNFPQAFSHIGLINAAWAISQAEAGTPGPR
jgi:GH15 family glucan-1,4-alpha-glucosidase